MITKHAVEKLIVPRPGTATPAAGTRLYHLTTGALNLAVGAFGVFVDVPGSGNPVAIDGTTNIAVLGNTTGVGRPFRIIMRRDTSNDAAILYDRYFEHSDYITNECILGVQYGIEPFAESQVNSWLIGNTTAWTVDNTKTYVLSASADGYRTDMMHSVYNTPFTKADVAGSVTDSVTGAENKLDYLIKRLVRDFNRKNSVGFLRNAFAIALDAGDGANTTAGPTVASIIAAGVNSSFIIGYDKECQPVNVLVTADRLQALTALEAWAVNASGLNLQAGDLRVAPYAFLDDNCTSAVEIAGDDVSAAKFVFMMAIDEALAYYDEVTQTKKAISVSLNTDNTTAVSTNVKLITAPNEGAGKGRDLRILWENTEDYRSYTSSKRWGANYLAFPNEILEGEGYDIYTFSHCANRIATSGMPSVSPHWTAIALVNTERDGGTTWSLDATNAQAIYLENVLNAYATAWGLPNIDENVA